MSDPKKGINLGIGGRAEAITFKHEVYDYDGCVSGRNWRSNICDDRWCYACSKMHRSPVWYIYLLHADCKKSPLDRQLIRICTDKVHKYDPILGLKLKYKGD